jgi:aspartate carbamoyltransferase catalytic subunit
MSATVHDIDERPAVTSLRSKDLLGISELTPDEITLILDTADAMKEIASRPVPHSRSPKSVSAPTR